MTTVQTFDRSMIRRYLDEKDLNYFIDKNENFILRFDREEEPGSELTCYLMAEGPESSYYCVRVYCNKLVPRSEWGQALLLCNSWMMEQCWPRACLVTNDNSFGREGAIILEEYIDLGPGIHQELLDEFTTRVITAGLAFWKRASEEKGW